MTTLLEAGDGLECTGFTAAGFGFLVLTLLLGPVYLPGLADAGPSGCYTPPFSEITALRLQRPGRAS